MRLEGDVWRAYSRDFKRSAFRLETQPTYTMPDEVEEVRRFLAGELTPPEGHNARWHATVRANIEAGKTMTRVRVVSQPLTDYQRYGFAWSVPGNIEAGEDIRVLDLTNTPLPPLPKFDFWLYDEATVVRLDYRMDGTQIARELVEPDYLPEYLEWRDYALTHSVPFREYQN